MTPTFTGTRRRIQGNALCTVGALKVGKTKTIFTSSVLLVNSAGI